MRTGMLLAALGCLVCASVSQAGDCGCTPPAPPPMPRPAVPACPATLTAYENAAPFGCAACGNHRPQESCFHHFIHWISYRAAWTKDGCGSCCCHKCCACCPGPLYTFFMCNPVPTAHVGNGFYVGQYPTIVAPCGP